MFEDKERMKELLNELNLEGRIEKEEETEETTGEKLNGSYLVIVEKNESAREAALEHFKKTGLELVFVEENKYVQNWLKNGCAGVVYSAEAANIEEDLTKGAEEKGIPYVFLKEGSKKVHHGLYCYDENFCFVYLDKFCAEHDSPSRQIEGGNKDQPETWRIMNTLLMIVEASPDMWKITYQRIGKRDQIENIDEIIAEKEKRMRNYKNA